MSDTHALTRRSTNEPRAGDSVNDGTDHKGQDDGKGASIAAVERDTGLGKDTLRVWERRYGFPRPQRDRLGERLYPEEQVTQLRVIKRLIDAGHRPRHIVGMTTEALLTLSRPATLTPTHARTTRTADTLAPSAATIHPIASDPVTETLTLLRQHDVMALRHRLSQTLLRVGLESFVCDHAAPLVHAVGEAWAEGALQIFEEHVFSETLESVLRQAILQAARLDGRAPRVLMSTLPDEPHRLGLLMAESLLVMNGCMCINLGSRTPLPDIQAACLAHRAHIVALSVSTAAKANQVRAGLEALRHVLPVTVELWVGTQLHALHQRPVAGVRMFDQLRPIGAEVRLWQADRSIQGFPTLT